MAALPDLTLDFVRRLEVQVAPSLSWPDTIVFGSTVAQRAVGGQPRNKVFCFSREDVSHMPEILEFYAQLELEPTFFLSPARFCPVVGAALYRSGFGAMETEQAILYGLAQPATPPPHSITFERVAQENLDLYLQVFADGFEWDEAWKEAAITGSREGFNFDAVNFLVRWEGEPAAVCGLNLRHGICHLGGGAVLPRFRGRGIHPAMLRYRLGLASELNSDFVMSGANFGSRSFINQIAAGMKFAYTELAFRRVR